MKHFYLKRLFGLLIILLTASSLHADAKVDGFFRENLVDEGYFNEQDFHKADASQSDRPTFFISREERKLNPNKAPSNNIDLPQHGFRVQSRTLSYPTPWGRNVSTVGTVTSK